MPMPAWQPNPLLVLAADVLAAAAAYREHARRYYYAVVLSGHVCDRCGGQLLMIHEAQCRCVDCSHAFDPTLAFQHCLVCGGPVRVSVRQYACRHCGSEIRPRFLFDGCVFDAEYFRQKMAEYRERRKQRRARALARLADSRSPALVPGPADMEGLAGLLAALGTLNGGVGPLPQLNSKQRFDLNRYEAHVRACCGDIAIRLDDMPALLENARLDRIWRFIAIIFLGHAGELAVRQEGLTIWVKHLEIDAERQGIPGDAEGADGVERPVGGTEA